MKLVTYDAGAGPRVGVLRGEDVADAGFDGDMVAFIDGTRCRRTTRGCRTRSSAPTSRSRGRRTPSSSTTSSSSPRSSGGACATCGPRTRPAASSAYTIWNDRSARDVQRREGPVGMGPGKAKDWDGSNVLGPCIVTADEFDASDARMRVRVNGELWGEDTTAHMHHTFADMIAYASRAQTLYPGEVLGSGTAAGGSGLELDRRLREGDVVELEIDGVGVLRNTIGRKGS
jgi:Fumarylacetoacetate (FAA) hydrolase family